VERVQRTDESARDAWIARRLWDGWASIRYLSPSLRVLPESEDIEAPLNGERDLLLLLWPYEDLGAALSALPKDRMISIREGARERGDLESQSRLLYVQVTARDERSQASSGLWQSAPDRATWEKGIGLVGYRLVPHKDRGLRLKLYWSTREPIDEAYTVFCHVLCGHGEGTTLVQVGQHDGPPARGYYGTDRWRVGDVIEDVHDVVLTETFDAQACEVHAGLYRWPTLDRLKVLDDRGRASDRTAIILH
jgi:hypothetical protein